MDENQTQGNNPVPNTPTPEPVAPHSAPASTPEKESGLSTTTSPTSQTTTPVTPTYFFTETTILAALSYIGPLVFIPFSIKKKEDPFIRFHIKQGLVLFGIGLICFIVGSWLSVIGTVLQIGVIIISVIGIMHALKKEEKALPIIGKYASHIDI
jgi:uncharacterized membrane protein